MSTNRDVFLPIEYNISISYFERKRRVVAFRVARVSHSQQHAGYVLAREHKRNTEKTILSLCHFLAPLAKNMFILGWIIHGRDTAYSFFHLEYLRQFDREDLCVAEMRNPTVPLEVLQVISLNVDEPYSHGRNSLINSSRGFPPLAPSKCSRHIQRSARTRLPFSLRISLR